MSSRKSWINRKRNVVNMAAKVVHLQWHLAPIPVPCIEAVDSSRHYSCAFLLASVLPFFFFLSSKTNHTEILIQPYIEEDKEPPRMICSISYPFLTKTKTLVWSSSFVASKVTNNCFAQPCKKYLTSLLPGQSNLLNLAS